MERTSHRRDGPNDSRTSNIPMPASAMKPPHQSLSSSVMRASTAQRPSSRATGPRQSVFGQPTLLTRNNPTSSRGQPPQGRGVDYGRTPVKNMTTSVLSGGSASVNRRSMAAQHNIRPARPGLPPSNIVIKESRPVRDKSYQQIEHREIYDYLLDIEFNLVLPTLSIKTLQSPTSREFQEIWKRLVQELDPDYEYPKNKKFEDEFVQVMKDLHYPHADSISKTSLLAVNTPHSWQAILASLHWMVQCAKIKSKWIFDNDNEDLYMQPVEELDLLSDAPELRHILQFDFLSKAYTKFWLGEDSDFRLEEEELIERYRQKTEGQHEAVEAMENDIDQILVELQEMKSKPSPLQAATAAKENIKAKMNKFNTSVKEAQGKVDKMNKSIDILKDDIAARTEEVRELEEEQLRIRAAIKEQNLSEAEVARMNSDQDSLSKNNAALTARLHEAKEVLHGLEVAITHRTETVEDDIAAYMALLAKCGLYPIAPEPVQDINFAIELNAAKSDPKEMTDAEIRTVIKPNLLKFKSAKKQEMLGARASIIDLEEMLEKLMGDMEEVREKINANNEERDLTQEQIETLKEKMTEEAENARVANAQLERSARELEDELSEGRGAAMAHRRNLEIEFESNKAKIQRAKEEIKTRIIEACTALSAVVDDCAHLLQDLEVAAVASDARTSALTAA